jgi:hypothetical protein
MLHAACCPPVGTRSVFGVHIFILPLQEERGLETRIKANRNQKGRVAAEIGVCIRANVRGRRGWVEREDLPPARTRRKTRGCALRGALRVSPGCGAVGCQWGLEKEKDVCGRAWTVYSIKRTVPTPGAHTHWRHGKAPGVDARGRRRGVHGKRSEKKVVAPP